MDNSLYVIRVNLKLELVALRGHICPLTGKDATDMHEAILSRAMVPKRLQEQIMCRTNCVLINNTKHILEGLTATDRLVLVAYLIEMESREAIENWISTVGPRTFPGLQPHINRLEQRAGMALEQASELIQWRRK